MKVLLAGLLASVALGGCIIHAHPAGPRAAHVHDDLCGHYWYNGTWYVAERHHHGPGCGHVFHDGYWAQSQVVVIERAHVHDAFCGHYYHGGSVYYMRGHRHGPGCGHNWNGKLWVSVRF